jgi:hypothetical protein
MSDDIGIRFSRAPYKVTYKDLQGEVKTIRRVPPPKLHDVLPTDVVSLSRQKSETFQEGDEFEVKHINPRHANTLQLVDADGATTFVDHYDVVLEEEVAPRPGVDPRDKPVNNRYLTWP